MLSRLLLGSGRWFPSFLLLLVLTGCDRAARAPEVSAPPVADSALDRPAAAGPARPPRLTRRFDTTAVGEFFNSRKLLRPYRRDAQEFYQSRGGLLGWFASDGRLRPQAYKLLHRAREAEADGIELGRYRIAALDRQLRGFAPDSVVGQDSMLLLARQRALDLQLTGTYFLLLGDYALGSVDAAVNGATRWAERRQYVHLARALAATLAARDTSARTYRFGARHPEYERLRRALTAYRELAKRGGWPLVAVLAKGAPALRPGMRDSVRVPVLRRRLAAEETLAAVVRGQAKPAAPSVPDSAAVLIGPPAPTEAPDPAVYDSVLVAHVAAFQARRGLKADGVIGAGTLAALRVPVTEGIRRIRLNMERWRWVPLKKRGRYLLVNIPEFTLHVVGAGGRDELTMRVIVGNKQKSTPIFADDLKYVVLAPYWNVPTSIVVKELRPHQARNRFYLKGEDMEVLRGDKVVPEGKIDWKTVNEGTLAPYRVRQLPGGSNPLGPIKFILPNDNDVYLHGTPFQRLFERDKRGFSHGCVRVEDPYRLALFLLRDQAAWTEPLVRETVAAGKPKWITLKQPLPTYLLYLTAWADADGAMHFRDDIYGHDHALGRSLGLGWGK